ncbi:MULTISPECIES: sensor histidine kinase KdpD [Pseudomonas]|uniref:sensor histidine kinase n=1 Tax=Pseudomonas TaxID=286 RepID=UPI0018E6B995|nr:HAMP domain-containing histidine kinase [Pseudomonas monteilii]MCE0936492.1 HAMP domain-containing histidine kinase [Pseudomonas kurunegalensis]
MRLYDFITQNIELILQAWEDFARTVETPMPDLDAAGLRNHAEAMLRTVALDMASSQTARQQFEKSRGMQATSSVETAAQAHAVTRLSAGFTLDQVVAEYRALRASVLRIWFAQQMADEPHAIDDMVRFNEAIDQALGESITSYGIAVETTRKLVLGVFGHDLRTPMTAALLGAEMLSRKGQLNERDRKIADQIAASVTRSRQIVTDLLDLAKANLGTGIPIQKEPVDLSQVCQTLVEELRISRPEITIVLKGGQQAFGQFDATRMGQVFSNLIANAFHHGDHARPITVTLIQGPEAVEFSVHNWGKPIAPDVVPHLFNPQARYSRLTSEHHEASGGLGLGLFIVGEIVARHGGAIDVQSSSSAGTTFRISLPLG